MGLDYEAKMRLPNVLCSYLHRRAFLELQLPFWLGRTHKFYPQLHRETRIDPTCKLFISNVAVIAIGRDKLPMVWFNNSGAYRTYPCKFRRSFCHNPDEISLTLCSWWRTIVLMVLKDLSQNNGIKLSRMSVRCTTILFDSNLIAF